MNLKYSFGEFRESMFEKGRVSSNEELFELMYKELKIMKEDLDRVDWELQDINEGI